jgi:hypothetical protein
MKQPSIQDGWDLIPSSSRMFLSLWNPPSLFSSTKASYLGGKVIGGVIGDHSPTSSVEFKIAWRFNSTLIRSQDDVLSHGAKFVSTFSCTRLRGLYEGTRIIFRDLTAQEPNVHDGVTTCATQPAIRHFTELLGFILQRNERRSVFLQIRTNDVISSYETEIWNKQIENHTRSRQRCNRSTKKDRTESKIRWYHFRIATGHSISNMRFVCRYYYNTSQTARPYCLSYTFVTSSATLKKTAV